MSLLLADKIKKEILSGNILAEPFIEKNLSINSIDVTLYNKLVTYVELKFVRDKNGNLWVKRKNPFKDLLNKLFLCISSPFFIDMKKENKIYEFDIPKEGIVLTPGILYLGSTVEKVGSSKFVPMYEGRSSMARLGVQSHISAGFGDLGFQSNWTLEINVVHPVKFYQNIRIGQVFFHEAEISNEEDLKKYSGKYTEQSGPQASKSYLDFKS